MNYLYDKCCFATNTHIILTDVIFLLTSHLLDFLNRQEIVLKQKPLDRGVFIANSNKL